MLSLETKIDLLVDLGNYMLSDNDEWKVAQQSAVNSNAWFTQAHISLAINNIVTAFLQRAQLKAWLKAYKLPDTHKTVGIVMAGNIPLVGFHDFLCGFVSGHTIRIKLSSKDTILLKHLLACLIQWNREVENQVSISEMLKGCDAYIATGSNNTARYFEQYFGKYPNIIRRNRTSVAVLDGNETEEQLEAFAADVFNYFGLGCRNVTQVCVPEGYDFNMLLKVCSKYNDVINHNKYKNNFDYYLAIYLLNKVPYLSNESLLMVENAIPFSAVSVLHYRFYKDKDVLAAELKNNNDIQAIIGNGFLPFGTSQQPALSDYADGIDTMEFLCKL